jgi:hypothetical protein
MPKSGTTALARLLGEASGLDVNSDPFHRLDRKGVVFRDALFGGELSIERLLAEHRATFRGGLVKDPNFPFFLTELLRLFPSAGFVFIVRDPRANVRSILNRLDLPGRPDEADDRPTNVSDTWRRVLEGRTPDVECRDYVHCAVERWRITTAAYRRHADRVTLVRYEDFNRDKPGVVKATLAGLGIPGDRPIDHLVDRQFQPRGDRTVSWAEFFGPERLAAIERRCAEEMKALGYTATEQGM